MDGFGGEAPKTGRILIVSEGNPQQLTSDEAREQLDEGLKSCRSVVQNYRLMLTGDLGDLQAANDDGAEPGSTDA